MIVSPTKLKVMTVGKTPIEVYMDVYARGCTFYAAGHIIRPDHINVAKGRIAQFINNGMYTYFGGFETYADYPTASNHCGSLYYVTLVQLTRGIKYVTDGTRYISSSIRAGSLTPV